MANTEVIEENKKYNEKQIFIVSFNGEYNLLMEAESADDADDWIIEIRDHIKFANSDADQEPAESSEAAKARALKAQSMKVTRCALLKMHFLWRILSAIVCLFPFSLLLIVSLCSSLPHIDNLRLLTMKASPPRPR